MGFWSTFGKNLLTIGGSLIPGVGPAIGLGRVASTAIGTGMGVAGSLAGGGGAAKATDTGQADLSEMANWLEPFGQKSMTEGQEGLESAMQFFKRLMSGDQAAVAGAVAPGVNTIVSQYDAARKSASEFGARGGGRNEMLAELPFKQAGDIAKLVQGAQLEGAKQLPQVASLLSQQGLGAAGLTAQNLRAILEQEMEKRKQNTELGVGIGQIAAMLLKNYLGGGTKSPGGGTKGAGAGWPASVGGSASGIGGSD